MRKISFIILFSLFVLPIKAQTIPIEYTYDNAGNRVKQKIVDLEYLSQMNDKHSDEIQPYLVDPILSIQATIFPNPTYGLINVALNGLTSKENVYLKIYDASGHLINEQVSTDTQFVLDFASYTSGIYMVQIIVGNEETAWKVIKK